MTPPDPDAALAQVAAALPPGPLAVWFRGAVNEFLEHDADLETALGLRGPGQLGRRAARRALARQREKLRAAFDLIPGPTPWARYQELAARIRALPRCRRPGPFEQLLLEAQGCRPLPTTPEGLLKALHN